MCSKASIDILLSYYNGSSYFQAQLISLFNQTWDAWKLILRDDGSSPFECMKLATSLTEYSERCLFILDQKGNLGAKKSFSELLRYSDAPYIAFCDQDDVWSPAKLQILLNAVQDLEGRLGRDRPCLVFSDAEVVGQNLEPISLSLWKYMNIQPVLAKTNTLFFRNIVPGCCMLINRRLARLMYPVPDNAVMHDYWAMLIAHLLGGIEFVPLALVKYRQHANTLGADRGCYPTFYERMRRIRYYLLRRECYKNIFLPYFRQAQELRRFSGMMTPSLMNMFQAFLSLPETPSYLRKWLMLKHGFFRGNALDNLELFLCL